MLFAPALNHWLGLVIAVLPVDKFWFAVCDAVPAAADAALPAPVPAVVNPSVAFTNPLPVLIAPDSSPICCRRRFCAAVVPAAASAAPSIGCAPVYNPAYRPLPGLMP